MCYFITVAIHEDYDQKFPESLKKEFTISQSNNSFLLNLLLEKVEIQCNKLMKNDWAVEEDKISKLKK